MMSLPRRTRTCIDCAAPGGFASGVVLVCPQTRRPIAEHAKANACPAAKFFAPPSRPPLPIPDDHDPEQERRRLKSGGCCGQPSKNP
jgi:hypothetical protein